MIFWDANRRLLKGNLHLHTTLSDGAKTPEEAMDIYRAAGYDFIAVSDHRRVTTQTCVKDGLLAIQSIEFDFSLGNQVMHIVGVDVPESIVPKVDRAAGPQRAIDEINASGGVAILAHPAWSLNTPEVMMSLRGVCAAEIYNSVSALPWNADRADSSNVLDLCAANGRAFKLVASDDAHFYAGDACQSWTMVAADENTPEAIKAALRRGDFYATRGPEIRKIEFDGEIVKVDTSPARAIWFPSELPWGEKRVVAGENLTHAEYRVHPLNRRFVRVVVEDEAGRRAWSNPIVFEK